MKKIISIFLLVSVCFTFFACGKQEGDLGKQTTVDKQNGYTITNEVKNFQFKLEEDELEEKENLRAEGFKVTPENAKGQIMSKTGAFDIALQEVTVEFNTITAYFDRTRGIWKVVFSDVSETKAEDGSISRTSVTKESVYIDEAGYTLFAYTE